MAITSGNTGPFAPGFALQDGSKLNAATGSSWMAGIVAHSGGTQAAAFGLTAFLNEIDTVAADNDSVKLPPAEPGTEVIINNNGAHTLAVYGAGADTIAAQGSTAQQPAATGVTQTTGVSTNYICTTPGQWKQGGVS